MVEVDEGGGNQQREENPEDRCRREAETAPGLEIKTGHEEFHQRITDRDRHGATRAAATQKNPTRHWKILMPRDHLVTTGTERALRIKEGDAAREAVNNRVQKGSRDQPQKTHCNPGNHG